MGISNNPIIARQALQPLAARVFRPTAGLPAECASWRTRFYMVILFVMAGIHTLLPIERGLPLIRLADGYPVTVSILGSFFCFACLVIESGGDIFKPSTTKRYLQWQSLFAVTLVIAAVASREPKAALFVVLNYFICFILNFLTLRYLFIRLKGKEILAIICIIVSVAAVVGLLEYLFGYYLPFYRDRFLDFDNTQMSFAMRQSGAAFRMLGPLGSPILHAITLALALPFALSLKGWCKWATAILLCVSILLSTSLTGGVMMGFYIVGQFARYVRRVSVLTLITCGLFGLIGLVVVGSGVVSLSDISAPFQRVIYGDENNIQSRLQMIDLGVSQILDVNDIPTTLVGRGLKASAELPSHGSYEVTFDNVWLTLAYEAGFPAAIFYTLLHIAVLHQLRRFIWTPHWWGILGWYAAGFSYVTIYYATANFLWVGLVAWLWTDGLRFDERRLRLFRQDRGSMCDTSASGFPGRLPLVTGGR